MKIFNVILLLLLQYSLIGQISYNIDFLDNWNNDTLTSNSSQVRYNDCWGFELENQEYAIAGSTEGIHFFKITNENKLNHVDFIAGHFNDMSVIHRDIKTYQKYAYAVCDEGESSLQIMDLSYLPDSVHLVGNNDSSFAQVHNIFIDTLNGLLYAGGITPIENGIVQNTISMQIFSLSNPINPTLIYTGPNDVNEVHDIYVRDNIAYLNCGFDGLRVYDFSDILNPIFEQNINVYQDQGYNHQGWLSPDGETYVFSDETGGKKLKKCKITSNNITIESLFGTNYEDNSVPHNVMISNEFAYVAYYNEGLRIYDIRKHIPFEIAYYDTYPENSFFNMQGAWGIYSELPSRRILVSDRHNGLFLLKFSENIFLNNNDNEILQVYPNPSSTDDSLTLILNDENISTFNIILFDIKGKKVFDQKVFNQSYMSLKPKIQSGLYYLYVNYIDNKEKLISIGKKIILN